MFCEVSVSFRPALTPRFRIGDRVTYIGNGDPGQIVDVWWYFETSTAAYVVAWDGCDGFCDDYLEEDCLCPA